MKRAVVGGVRKQPGNFVFDYTYNLPDDIIEIVPPQLYSDITKNRIYFFGYRFSDTASSQHKTEFIHHIKQIGDNPISDRELEQFIEMPLASLNEMINLYSIDCFVYPVSQRSPLVNKIIESINSYTSHDTNRCSFEFVKSVPTDVSFDFESFKARYEGCQGYDDMLNHINNKLIPDIHSLDYFSIARDVKSKYRPYIKDFLNFSSEDDVEKYSKLNGQNILIIDDINTTSSTINEILRILNKVNNNCNIFIYTLIGK